MITSVIEGTKGMHLAIFDFQQNALVVRISWIQIGRFEEEGFATNYDGFVSISCK